MKKFNVCVTVYVPISTVLEVQAEDADVAEETARTMVLTHKDYIVHDFNGNAVDLLDSDIVTDDVYEM